MKIAIITDTHLGARNDSPHMHQNFKDSSDWFFDYLDTNGIKRVIHAGDLYDRRKYISFVTAQVAREYFLDRLEQRGIETDIIAGNHDEYYKNTHVVNSLREMVDGKYKHITVHDTPKELNIDGTGILLLPWITQSNEQESIQAITNSRSDILVGHLELHGFEMQKGVYSDHGMDFTIFNRFDAVYTGHYHKRSSSVNVHYIGAFSEFTWSDFNCARGFSIFDTETRKIEFIKNPHILFKGLVYDDVKDENILDTINAADYSKYANAFTKVVVTNKTNPYAFDLLLSKLSKAGPIDISIVEDSTAFVDNSEDEIIDQVADTPTILDNYIKGLTLPVENDKMMAFMREIYKEAIALE